MNLRYIPLILTGFLIYSASAFLPTAALATITIPLSVTLTEAVTVTGTPQIAVDVGGTTRYATYTSGSGTVALTFTLSPQAGDVDLDGISVSSPIQLNGGTIKDAAGNDATLTFTPPNTSGIKVNYPSLSMDFVYDADGRYTLNGTAYNDLTSFLTATGGSFTRNSVATHFDSTGTLQTATANQPRFDYDPSTLQPKGILIEESRRNYINNSDLSELSIGTNSATTNWSITTASLGGNITVINTGIQNGIPYIDLRFNIPTNTTGVTKYPTFSTTGTQTAPVASGTKTVASAWFGITNYSATGGTCSTVFSNRSYSAGGYLTEASLAYTATTSYRYQTTPILTHGATATYAYSSFYVAVPNNVACDVTIRVGAPQFEIGAFATSYIPTTTAPVTRLTETLNVTAGSWYNPVASTFYANAYSETNSNQAYRGRWIAYNSAVILGNGGTASSIETWSGSSPSTQIPYSPASSQTQAAKAALAWDTTANTRSLVANGGTIQTTSIPGSYNISSIYIGCCGSAPGELNAPIREVRYYPLRLTSAQIQQLTQ